jgi:hypothetical protein
MKEENRKTELTEEEREMFVEAFSTGLSGYTETCSCGKEYYDSNSIDRDLDGEDDPDDEVDRYELRAKELEDRGVILVRDYVRTIRFEGKEYVENCECWHTRAAMIYGFLTSHADHIAHLINEQRLRAFKKAARMPIVGEDQGPTKTIADGIVRRSIKINKGARVVALKDITLQGHGDSSDMLLCRAGETVEVLEHRMEPDLFTVAPRGEEGLAFIMHRQEFEAAVESKRKTK